MYILVKVVIWILTARVEEEGDSKTRSWTTYLWSYNPTVLSTRMMIINEFIILLF